MLQLQVLNHKTFSSKGEESNVARALRTELFDDSDYEKHPPKSVGFEPE